MRQIGAALLGAWYSIILCFSLTAAVKALSRDVSGNAGNHYFILGLTWLVAVGFAAFLAGSASRSHPIGVCFFAMSPVIALCFFLLEAGLRNYRLPDLAFGWGPTAYEYLRALLCLSIGACLLGGLASRSGQLGSVGEKQRILGVGWGHWLWLWVPMSSWAGMVPGSIYLIWLTVASDWHWLVHPSLWFNWHWWVYFGVGIAFVALPYGLLSAGVSAAWEVLALGKERGVGKGSVALRFVAWGYGCGVIGTTMAMALGFWIFAHLPIAAKSGMPWWVIF